MDLPRGSHFSHTARENFVDRTRPVFYKGET
jgi:hypothetical protein